MPDHRLPNLVVVPTFNEAGNIGKIVQAVLSACPDCDLLVVDDGSPDGTGEIVGALARENARLELMQRESKSGLGRSYVAGFSWGLERGYERFLEMDADFSHDPGDIPRLISTAQSCDLSIGSRYVSGGGVEGWSKSRHLLSRSGNIYAQIVLGLRVRDSTSGFRCYRREVLEKIDLAQVRSDGYAFQIDMAYRTQMLGFKVCETPIVFRERSEGTSKMSKAIVMEGITSVTRWAIRDLFTGRRFSKKR
ncbi:MAG: polyprenol monophosphomannose synthase [Acidimicrobiia bacterium]